MTKSDKRLSERQELAIDYILQGLTDKEVAEKVGVTRQTVNEWKNKNSAFIAELNRKKKMLYEAIMQRLINLSSKALETVEREIDNGNWKLAFEVLKIAGFDKSKKEIDFGKIDENEIERDMKMSEMLSETF